MSREMKLIVCCSEIIKVLRTDRGRTDSFRGRLLCIIDTNNVDEMLEHFTQIAKLESIYFGLIMLKLQQSGYFMDKNKIYG